jgi:hypothetical protein
MTPNVYTNPSSRKRGYPIHTAWCKPVSEARTSVHVCGRLLVESAGAMMGTQAKTWGDAWMFQRVLGWSRAME